MKFQSNSFRLIGLCALFTILLFSSCKEEVEYVEIEAPVLFSSTIPVDVDPELQTILKDEKDVYALNEVFNLYSWQAFVAINWPVDADGNPKNNFTDSGDPSWINWKEAFQVYRSDGKKPAAWNAPRTASGLEIDPTALQNSKARIILQGKTPTHPGNINIADETDQAFAGELFDQNGNLVVYEVLMNKEEFDYIIDNKLYNINGQLEFSKKNTDANFPKGDWSTQELGAIEIKFAWKKLTNTDYKERYFTSEACVWNKDTQKCEMETLGMIGMHISQKTPTGKQWVWSTFEHVDNLVQNTIEVDGETKLIHPTLRDPECEICPVNVDMTVKGTTSTFKKDKHGTYWEVVVTDPNTKKSTSTKYYAKGDVMKTQAKRMIDIPLRVRRVNELMQAYFEQENSVWQYYQLIDTQYPLHQDVPPANHTQKGYKIPPSITNKPGGDPNLVFLTNITMETFFQAGNRLPGAFIEGQVTSDYTVFGTESCMGCHSSAAMYNKYNPKTQEATPNGQLTADFSWLMGRANWEEGVPKPKK